jgi:hypothetical protein
MASFDDFLKELEGELKDLIQKSWKTVSGQASKDAQDFIKESEDDLKRWTGLLANHSITLKEFEFLVGAEKDLVALTALKQAGLGQIQLDRFIQGVIGAVVNAASKLFA